MPNATKRRSVRTHREAASEATTSPEPRLAEMGGEVQRFGALRLLPIALSAEAREESCQLLNGILADTMILYALYKKHHWLVAGPDVLPAPSPVRQARRRTARARRPARRARPDPRWHRRRRPASCGRAHLDRTAPERRRGCPLYDPPTARRPRDVIEKVRNAIDKTEASKDWGSNDLLMGDVLRRHELQVWFVAEHAVDIPLIER